MVSEGLNSCLESYANAGQYFNPQYSYQTFTPMQLNTASKSFIPYQQQADRKQTKKQRLKEEKEQKIKEIHQIALASKQEIPLNQPIFDLDEVAYDIIMNSKSSLIKINQYYLAISCIKIYTNSQNNFLYDYFNQFWIEGQE